MTLQEIEKMLEVGQASPNELVDAKDWLAASSSEIMDRQLWLQLEYAKFFKNRRDLFKSDKAVLMDWQSNILGIEELELETKQRKIKVLREAISSHLRINELNARNLL